MAKYNLLLPKMGESVSEATIVKWIKQVGDPVEFDESILEIATDKVDSDVPSPVNGILMEQLFNENDVAQVGDVIAVLEIEGEDQDEASSLREDQEEVEVNSSVQPIINEQVIPGLGMIPQEEDKSPTGDTEADRFLSPLVRSIASEEGIALSELESIPGSGLDGRITKQDILNYIASKAKNEDLNPSSTPSNHSSSIVDQSIDNSNEAPGRDIRTVSGDEIIEMDRMRRLIADHMLSSLKTSAHVSSFLEADVTNIVNWRNKHKDEFEKREGTKITYTPIFIEAVVKALRDFPLINSSVEGTQIIKKKEINIGMATALPSGNLIVPVIKNADQLNLVGISKAVNDLAQRARTNTLKPDETQNGTFTLTNIGSFGNIMGTPIINQPQVAILAVGIIAKKPAVIETEEGDLIGIRNKMFLSLSYDHRIIDGALGGMFLRRIADYLESWDGKE